MSTITLPNIRVGSDLQVKVRLKDGGVAIDWTTLTKIRAHIYSDAQRALAGRCDVSVDAEDPTLLVCDYAATKPQYLGVTRIIVQASYMGEMKTYDKPAFNFVRWTDDQEGEEITIEDPDVDVEINVEDVSSSIIQNILDACIKATEEAREVVDTSRGPRGYSAYEIAVQDGFEGTEEEWLESLQGETGPQGPQGEQGETGPAGVTDVEVDVSPSSGTPAGTGSVYDGTLSLHFTGLKGQSAYEVAVENGFEGTEEEWLASLVGPQGQQGVKGDTGAKGDKGDTGETGPQGLQGNTGSSQAYPFELVNNETTDDATKAHSAAGAKRLKDEISQLEAEVHNLSGKYYGVFTSANDLPEGDANGYAFVGTEEPFEIYNCVGGEWEDSGAKAVGIQGPQGNSGYTGAAGELEVVNNLEDGGPTAALSAEAGKLLARNMKLLYDSMGAAAFWDVKPDIDWSGNSVPVSLSLSNCSSSNIASYVALGDPYYTEITPDSGSILASVSCTMNGEVVPVVNGVINIAQVTGAILITAVGANLNTIAYDGKTYKQIFETNNTLGISPGFDNGSYSPLTVGAGSPTITTEEADTGQYSLKCSGTSSQQVRTSGSFGDKGFVACRVKVTSWTAGYCGAQYNSINAGANYVTDGWETKVIHRGNTSPTSAVFVGSYSSANLTGYVDSPVFVKDSVFSTVPTTEKFTQLYNEYIAIKKAS